MSATAAERYRFGPFILSPSRRCLWRDGKEVALIPRYFDLLLHLLQARDRVVTRREIMDVVWSDVVVSDGALTQAVRTLRRTLGDDPRHPVYIRTVSRHGYQFAFDSVEVNDDRAAAPTAGGGRPPTAPAGTKSSSTPPASSAASDGPPARPGDTAGEALACLVAGVAESEWRDAAERLHAVGTAEALRRLDDHPDPARARAMLRETRWDVAGAGEVPLLGRRHGVAAMAHLVGLRLRRAARLIRGRWSTACVGGALAGVVAGLVEGLVLRLAEGPALPANLPLIYATLGALVGAVGGAGVGAGLVGAEALARSRRRVALVLCGAAGGGSIGALAHLAGRASLEGIFGQALSTVGGGVEGVVLGAAAGLGYALSTVTPQGGGMAAPRGARRWAAALATGACCCVAALLLTAMGGRLTGTSLEVLARSFHGSQVGLQPLARLLGESTPGPLTRAVQSGYEGLLFGIGLAWGLTRRPR